MADLKQILDALNVGEELVLDKSELENEDPGIEEESDLKTPEERVIRHYFELADVNSWSAGNGSHRSQSKELALLFYERVTQKRWQPDLLFQIGYLLLLRCRVENEFYCLADLIPEFSWYSPLIEKIGWGPECPDKILGLNLAASAFGRAYFAFLPLAEIEGTGLIGIHAQLALDCLRATFLTNGDIAALEAVWTEWNRLRSKLVGGYHDLLEYNFYELRGYLTCLKDRLTAADSQAWESEQEVLTSQKLFLRQLKNVLDSASRQTLSLEEVEALFTHIADTIASKVNRTPHYVIEASEEKLTQDYGERWLLLPPQVRRLLIQAQYLWSICEDVRGVDWAPVVMQLIRAIEVLLRQVCEPIKSLTPKPWMRLEKMSIGQFAKWFEESDFVESKQSRLAQAYILPRLANDLQNLDNNYRDPVSHGAEPMADIKAMEAKTLILGKPSQTEGLLWQIAAVQER